MPVRIGPFDPIALIFGIMNVLMKRGLMSYDEAMEVLQQSLDQAMPEEEREKLLGSLLRRA